MRDSFGVNFRRRGGVLASLLAGASVIGLGAIAATPAFAQDSGQVGNDENSELGADVPPSSGAAETDEDAIVITGIRASLRNAVQIKRNAEQIVDSITAQDIGALPDRSVSEALQRIPGVTLQRTNENRDPARLAAEGGGVFIRGLSWVRSEVNGRDIFSANSGRALSFEDVSADLLAGVDVYKNPSAELIEGGVGGLVNLRTRKPFDQSGQLIAFSADYNYADLRDKGFWSANALYSNRWDTGAGEFGILLSGSIGNIGNRTDSIQTGRYEERTLGAPQDGFGAGDHVYIPNSIGFRRIDWQQRRTALVGSAQWRPVPDLQFTAEAIYTKATPRDIERAVGDNGDLGTLPTDHPSYTFDSQGAITSGSVDNRAITTDTRYGERTAKTQDYSLNLSYTPDSAWAFSADVQHVRSSADVLSMTAFAQLEDRANVEFDFSGDKPFLALTTPGDANLDQGSYWWAAAMDHLEDNSAKEWAYRADAEYAFEDDDFLKSFRFGARATDKNATTRQTGWHWDLLSNQFWGNGGGAAVYLDQTGGTATTPPNAALPDQSDLYTYEDFFRGNVSVPGAFWFPSEDLVSNGTAHAGEMLAATLTSGWGWTPLQIPAAFQNATPAGDNVSGGINKQQEKTLAGYALLRFGSEGSGLGRFDGNVGVRVVQTRNDAEGAGIRIQPLQNAPSVAVCVENAAALDLPASACDPLAAALDFLAGGVTQIPVETKNEYTNILPSLNLRFFLAEDTQLRFAAARAMVRPNFNQLNTFTSLSFNFQQNGLPPGVGVPGAEQLTPFTGIGGSPRLKPTTSDQFDVSLEHYFGDTGQLSFAAFYKRIKNYIFAGQVEQTFTSNGQDLTFELTQQMNGDKGSVKGFELAYQQFYDFLPGALNGLGLQANFTYIDSSGGRNTAVNIIESPQLVGANDATLPLEGMSKYSYNVALMYEKYGISARLAYNWRSEYLLTTSAANIQRPVWSEDYGQLDGSILYSVTPNVKIGVQATNILNSRTFLDVGGTTLKPRYSWTDSDRRIAFLIRGQF